AADETEERLAHHLELAARHHAPRPREHRLHARAVSEAPRLFEQARLAEAAFADEEHSAGLAGLHLAHQAVELAQLVAAPDHRLERGALAREALDLEDGDR